VNQSRRVLLRIGLVVFGVIAVLVAIIVLIERTGETLPDEGTRLTVRPTVTPVSGGPPNGSVASEPDVTSARAPEIDAFEPVTAPQPVAPPGPVSPPEPPPPPPPDADPTSVEITITAPTEGSKVDHMHLVEGTVSDLSLTVLVVVTTFEDSAFWVQHKAQVRARKADDGSGRTIGRWYSPVYFGRSRTQDRGKGFAVMAIATANPEQFRLGERLGPVPADVAQSDPVTVVRK
jgi:hypothetical protein